jgi:hypothetical protein
LVVAQTAVELEADITHTREDVSATLDVIGDQLPKRVVKVGTRRFRRWIQSGLDAIMGSESEIPAAQGTEGLGEGAAQSGQGSAATTDQNHGNPIAAGLISFGVGLLVGSLLPPTKLEKQGLSAITDRAEPAIDAAIRTASEIGQAVQKSTGHAVSEIGETLTDAGQEIADHVDPKSESVETGNPPATE